MEESMNKNMQHIRQNTCHTCKYKMKLKDNQKVLGMKTNIKQDRRRMRMKRSET